MNRTLKAILKFWYVYLLLIAVSVVGTIYYCDFINMPRNEETISLFICNYSSNNEALFSFLKEKSPDYLREINITSVNPHSSDFDYYMVNKGLNKADIFLLSESRMGKDLLTKQFAELKSDVLSSYFTYESEDLNRGVLYHKKGDSDSTLISIINDKYEDENYYLFYRVNSKHIKGLNDSKFDTALSFTKELLNYEKK